MQPFFLGIPYSNSHIFTYCVLCRKQTNKQNTPHIHPTPPPTCKAKLIKLNWSPRTTEDMLTLVKLSWLFVNWNTSWDAPVQPASYTRSAGWVSGLLPPLHFPLSPEQIGKRCVFTELRWERLESWFLLSNVNLKNKIYSTSIPCVKHIWNITDFLSFS